MTTQDRYAVFGDPISHSKSPRIHQLFAEQTEQCLTYSAQQVPAEQFHVAVQHFFLEGGKGLNCTIPLKELAWHYASSKTPRAQLSGAVNTLALQADGTVLGDNTDGVGLINDLANHGIGVTDQRILILGAGGASRGIIGPLLEHEPERLVIANRTEAKAYDLARIFSAYGDVSACGFDDLTGQQFDVIINASAAGLKGDLPPLPAKLLAEPGYCYDLVYSNQPTAFVRWGIAHRAIKSVDGLGMLVEQAAEAFSIWRNIKPETTAVIALLNAERGL